MNGPSCTMTPEVNGNESRLYKDLLKRLGDRPLTNYMYSSYTSSNMADAMDRAGKLRDSNNEHKAGDFLAIADWKTIQREILDLDTYEKNAGFVDDQGKRVNFDDPEQALNMAKQFNDARKGVVATVLKHGDVYQIVASQKDSSTYLQPVKVEQRLQVWDIYKNAFNSIGVDINSLPQELKSTVNPFTTDLARYLAGLQRANPNLFNYREALMLFSLNQNTPEVQNLINSFGSLEDAAQGWVDFKRDPNSLRPGQGTLLNRGINASVRFGNLDLRGIQDQVNQLTQNILDNSGEADIKKELHRLNKMYNVDANVIHRVSDKVNKLSEAVADSAVQLRRKIRKLERELGATHADVKKLKDIHKNLMEELESKRYHAGMIRMMQDAIDEVLTIDDILADDLQVGSELEKNLKKAENRYKCDQILKKHEVIIATLLDDRVTIDEDISQADLDNMRRVAADLLNLLDEKRKVVDSCREAIFRDIMLDVLGDEMPDATSLVHAVKLAMKDSSVMDKFYSIGRVSNPFVAAVGSIIRRAEISRKEALEAITRRIEEEDDRLAKAGFNSKFIYEESGGTVHIISDIDWDAYEDAKEKERKDLIKQLKRTRSYSPEAVRIGMEMWEEQNTIERMVDPSYGTNGRTERIPNNNYRKPLPPMEPAQKRYYEEMMKIKGELGSILPEYARFHYRPPQKRRTKMDAFLDVRNPMDLARIIKNKWLDIATIREDDETYQRGGVIEGVEYSYDYGDYNNNPLREIPIYHINELKDQRELLKDFSGAMQALAGTAINYSALSGVLDSVMFLKDYILSQDPRGETAKTEKDKEGDLAVFKDLYSVLKNTGTEDLLETMVAMHFFNESRHETEKNKKWMIWWDNIIKYTSFKNLSTNFKGWGNNFFQLEYQTFLESLAGEFYNFVDYVYANVVAFFGWKSGLPGEIRNLFSNNRKSKIVLLMTKFDPEQDQFESMKHKRYYRTWFRRLISNEVSFLGYALGEFVGRMVHMIAILHNRKVLVNGKKTHMLNAYEVAPTEYGSYELRLKAGTTDLEGNPITDKDATEEKIFNDILYCTQGDQGVANQEDKGIIHQRWYGRGVLNFRQWMIEYYSKRLRSSHYDYSLKQNRTGQWKSAIGVIAKQAAHEAWEDQKYMKAASLFFVNSLTFLFRAKALWPHLDAQQRGNVRRCAGEMLAYFALLCPLEVLLGSYSDHKKERWRRYFIYQIKRLKLDAEAALPTPALIDALLIKTFKSPMAGVDTLHDIMYIPEGLTRGDWKEKYKKTNENKYWHNLKRHVLPFFKHWDEWTTFPEDDAMFYMFKDNYFRK